MAASLITQILTLFGVAPTTANPTNFDALADALLGALPNSVVEQNAFRTQANALATQANIDAQSAAASAAAAQALAGAVAFNAATAYPQYGAAISTVNLLTYRRKTAGTSATDPSADPANWVNTGLPPVVVVRTAVNVNPMLPGVTYIATAAGITLTLPAAPGAQDVFYYRGGLGIGTWFIAPGGATKFEGVAATFSVDLPNLRGSIWFDAVDGYIHIR